MIQYFGVTVSIQNVYWSIYGLGNMVNVNQGRKNNTKHIFTRVSFQIYL